jgi:Type II secretion system (T2SS), protein M subtype b
MIAAHGYERKAVGSLVLAMLLVGLSGLAVIAVFVSSLIEQRRSLAELQAAVALAEAERKGEGKPSPAVAQLTPRLFKAATPAEFQAQLQSLVKDVAARHSVTVDSLQSMNAERAGGLNKLALRMDAAVPNAALGPFLADLATGEPLVLLKSMELRPLLLQANRLNNGGRPDNAMQARLDFTAYAANAAPRALDAQGRKP